MKKVIICGPSCSGKTTIKQNLVATGLKPGISYTTRQMRDGEQEGVDYHFVSKEDFSKLIDAGAFFEYDDTFDGYYGTSNQDFEKCDVFILTPKAIEKLKKAGLISKCIGVYLTAPIHVRIVRAMERGDSYKKIVQRISNDSSAFSSFVYRDIKFETNEENIQEIIELIRHK